MTTSYTPEEIDLIVRWIVENVTAAEVPPDEGNERALIYNLIQLARNGRPYEKYVYGDDQDKIIERLEAEKAALLEYGDKHHEDLRYVNNEYRRERDSNEVLRAENEKLREALELWRELLHEIGNPWDKSDYSLCFFCESRMNEPHDGGCIYIRAKRLIGDSPS